MNTPEYTPYKDALTKAMTDLASLDDSIFIGQQIIYAGNPMSTTLGNVPKEKMIEVPVMEETQMGMSLGLAIAGKRVITFYPRWDFIVSAANQLINHVDKFELMTGKKLNLIIRLGKGSDTPLDPGHQHKGNYIEEFKSICKNIEFHDLKNWGDIELAYTYAMKEGGIHCLVEYPELYYKN
ncbi:MAG: Prochlorococcus phage [Bacteroidota bacterium]|jgi:pyruvate/2-oxoglutarate/acetoin dehydrogenase E1 component